MNFAIQWPSCIGKGDCGFCDIIQFADSIYRLFFSFIGIAMLVMFFIGAITILISRGDAEKVAGGKSKMLNSIIGGIIALSSWMIVNTTLAILTGQFSNLSKTVVIKGVPWNQICEESSFIQHKGEGRISEADKMCIGKGNGAPCYGGKIEKGEGICYKGECVDSITISGRSAENPCEYLKVFGGGSYGGVLCVSSNDSRITKCLEGDDLCPGNQKCCWIKE